MGVRRTAAAAACALLLLPLPAFAGGADRAAPARVQPWLQEELARVQPEQVLRVYVHADTAEHARAAAGAAGLTVVETFEQIAVTVADGPARAVRRAARQPHVSYVEGDVPAELTLDKAHRATRNAQAQASRPAGRELSGTGVSVAVIDTGIDGTHPFFRRPDGTSKVVANHKTVCHNLGYLLQPPPNSSDSCWAPVLHNDSDTGSAGGHGTHVAGIVAGAATTARSPVFGSELQLAGAAPGASLVALSVGAGPSIYGGNTGMNWVLEHHAQPCGPGVDRRTCPPIRVTNSSYGPAGGSSFDPEGVTTKLQRALVAAGVTVVWAAGNDGGDGSGKDAAGRAQRTNGSAADPTPGVLMVASYDHGSDGTRDGKLSGFSSRGTAGSPETYPDLAAPGGYILSSCRVTMPLCTAIPYDGPGPADLGTFGHLGGTSMAAPYVAGVVAELLQLDPSLTPGQIEIALEDGAHRFSAGAPYEADPANPGSPTSFDKGHGLVDVVGAVERVRAGRIVVPQAAPRPAPAPFPLPAGQLSCSTAVTDDAGDARDSLTRQDRPSMDLVAARWSWDGQALTATFVVPDLAAARGPGGTGEQFSWSVVPARGAPFEISTSTGLTSLTQLRRRSSSVSVTRSLLDRPGAGPDEVRVRFSRADLARLAGSNPELEPGLALVTERVTSAQLNTFVATAADSATGEECGYVVGAADRVS